MMAQAPAAPTPTEALADAMAPFLTTRQQPDDLTEADQRALTLGRARAAEACQKIDAQMLDARTPLELARLCLFSQQYEPSRQAALRALHTVPEAGQWEAHQLLAEAFLGLDNPVNAAIQLLAVEASGHFDPAAYRLEVRALDAGGVLQDRSMNALCHVQLTHALALLEQGKVLEDASDTIAPDQMMRDAYFSLSLLQARHEATDATLEARLQKAAQLPAFCVHWWEAGRWSCPARASRPWARLSLLIGSKARASFSAKRPPHAQLRSRRARGCW